MAAEAIQVSGGLQKGIEVPLSPDSLKMWQTLQERFIHEATLHPDIPNYILWDAFNKSNGGKGDGVVTDTMAVIIAEIFGPTKPTHVLGIMDSGASLALAVFKHLVDQPGILKLQLEFAQRSFDPPTNEGEIVVEGSSYKRQGQPCYFTIPKFDRGSVVLVIDDTAALGKAATPCVEGIISQTGVTLGGFAVGLSKNFQGWESDMNAVSLQKGFPQFPLFSVVPVSGITYENGNTGLGQIQLVESREALKIR